MAIKKRLIGFLCSASTLPLIKYPIKTGTLKELVPTAKITPNTKFADLGLGSHKLLKTLLSEKYQLRAPNTDLSGIGCLGITLVWVVVGFWLNNNGFTLWYLTVAVGLGLFILHFLPGKFGGTVGAFSQSLADQNYAHFVRNGARADRQGLWEALSGIIESEVGLNLGFDSNTLLGPEEWYDIEWLRNFRRARQSKHAHLIDQLSEAQDFLLSLQIYRKGFQLSLESDLRRWIETLEREEPINFQEVEAAFAATGMWGELSTRIPGWYTDEATELADLILHEIERLMP